MSGIDQLDFEHHRQQYERLAGANPNAEAQKYFLNQAMYVHSLEVFNALRDLYLSAVQVAQDLNNAEAKYFIQHGVARRLNMMRISYGDIIQLIRPDRADPLIADDVANTERDLNVIYINIRGALDNYAWCLGYEVNPVIMEELKTAPMGIGLFSAKFVDAIGIKSFAIRIGQYQSWYEDLKSRRDPSAHRIPLYVPPAAWTPEHLVEYQTLDRQIKEACENKNFELANKLLDQLGKVGTFMPYFLHHPNEPIIPIYPTVPQDIANLVKIGRYAHIFLRERDDAPNSPH